MKPLKKFMESVKGSLAKGENVYLRGFGSFIVKKRAQKNGSQYFQKYYDNNSGPQHSGI